MALQFITNGMRQNWNDGCLTIVSSPWLQNHLYGAYQESDIPYPSPADRRDLENLVKGSWDSKVQKPMGELTDYGSDQFHHAKEWIFDTWSDSQLKAFLDRHAIPAPQPRRRDVLLKTARENYEAIAKKIGETASYPGDWIYDQWTESDLKEWLDERGWPVPQPTTRDQLIASVRRNGRLASLQARSLAASASKSADMAQATLSDAVFNAWSDSELKKFLDSNGVPVPQGTKRNELIALARKHRTSLLNQAATASKSAADFLGAATSKAGNEYAKATDDAKLKANDAFDAAVESWSNSRLKAFLDARGVPVPQANKRDELLAMVRANKHRMANQWNAWTFETWHTEQLKKYLSAMNVKPAQHADVAREKLVKQAQDAYAKASKAGGSSMASATSYMAHATDTAKETTFENWSHSDLKAYLDAYGIPVYQGSSLNELRAAARRNSQYFKYGTTSPQGTLVAKLQETAQWILDQLKIGASSGRVQGQKAMDDIREKAEGTHDELRSEL
ncbi:hypothetical protein PHISCL_06727 [Aspergillus sclerotialis]|uniref:Stress response protein n=1 Tax=Aspergillus sclerotialis TaxID=2070753 RepID=A0A3A2ZNJ9_9EURO|nr:hypothetical protein PHISCL_06727 [Aspergillus sclerotialis]